MHVNGAGVVSVRAGTRGGPRWLGRRCGGRRAAGLARTNLMVTWRDAAAPRPAVASELVRACRPATPRGGVAWSWRTRGGAVAARLIWGRWAVLSERVVGRFAVAPQRGPALDVGHRLGGRVGGDRGSGCRVKKGSRPTPLAEGWRPPVVRAPSDRDHAFEVLGDRVIGGPPRPGDRGDCR
jgi:hypothetical protein